MKQLGVGILVVAILWLLLAGGGTLLSIAYNNSLAERAQAEALLVQAQGLADIANAVSYMLRTMTSLLALVVVGGLLLAALVVGLLLYVLRQVVRLTPAQSAAALPAPPAIQILVYDPTQQVWYNDDATVGLAAIPRATERELTRR